MNPMQTLTIFPIALLAGLSAHAQGLIWSANSSRSIGGPIGAPPFGTWGIAFDHVSNQADYQFPWIPPSQHPATMLFSMSLVTNDSGRTFFANTMNEPGFAGFVASFTDGANNYIRFQAPDTSSLIVLSEANFLGRSALAPDLAGYNITQIGFRVNSFYDDYDGTEDRWMKRLDYSLDFYGAPVPEPGTWALLTLGGVATLLLRRKARSKMSRFKARL
jgi:hypothetical protein